MSGNDGLRSTVAHRVLGLVKDVGVNGGPSVYDIADAVLALPEVAALRAKAAAADRVRELHWPLDRGTGPQCQGCATHVSFTPWPCPTIAALDGPPC